MILKKHISLLSLCFALDVKVRQNKPYNGDPDNSFEGRVNWP
jgi:hypothetical protein